MNSGTRIFNQDDNDKKRDANPDPITGAPGSHPVGTGLGAVGAGAAAGAAGGAIAGPVGAAIGAVAGAVAGGYAGKAAAEAVNPTEESAYWRENYRTRPYADRAVGYEEYEPAYRYGWENAAARQDADFDRTESDLARGWEQARGRSQLEWERAKDATRDAWDRVRSRGSSRPDRSSSDRCDPR